VLALDFLSNGEPRMEVFNLGCGGNGHTIREVIDCARDVTGRTIPVEIGSRREGDPPVLVATSVKAMRELGWKPKRERLDVIIESAWKWMGLQARSPESRA
jgi:UDP-glucose 4-epimerase